MKTLISAANPGKNKRAAARPEADERDPPVSSGLDSSPRENRSRPDDMAATREGKTRKGRWVKTEKGARPFTAATAGQFADWLEDLAAGIHDLPPDLAENHDHYLHGHPKK